MCHRTGYNVFLVSYRYTIAQALEKGIGIFTYDTSCVVAALTGDNSENIARIQEDTRVFSFPQILIL